MKQKNINCFKNFLTEWSVDESGSMTILSLYFILIGLIIGGIAIDFNKLMSERTQLQIAADTAAHAALYTREENSASVAKTKAMTTIVGMLPEHQFGNNAILDTDIAFGTWDRSTLSFVENTSSDSAVRVRAQMLDERGNASHNLLLNIIGQDSFEVAIDSVYTTYFPNCFDEGFVAESTVNIQSNSSFSDGFCIHSNDYVSLNQNNFFEPGTIVSMPDIDNLSMPKSGFTKNEGLQTALRQGKYRMRLLAKLPKIINSFWNAEREHLPSYVGASYANQIFFDSYPGLPADAEIPKSSSGSLTPYHFESGAVNMFNCYDSDGITLDAGTYSQFVFITDCEIKFANGVALEDVVVATTNTNAKSLNSPQGLQIGRNDNCAAGGGATLMTLGGFDAAASLGVANGQILALGDIKFAASADGVQGASFVSNGRIDGTSDITMGFCGYAGMENAYRAPYFRMVN